MVKFFTHFGFGTIRMKTDRWSKTGGLRQGRNRLILGEKRLPVAELTTEIAGLLPENLLR